MTFMRRLLTPRHVAVSVGAGLAVFVLFTSVIGMAVAQDDAPQDAPATFVTARPMFGDVVMYGWAGVERTDGSDGPEEMHCEEDLIDINGPDCETQGEQSHEELRPFGPFEWGFDRTGEIGVQRDAAGVVHDVEYIAWGVTEETTSAPIAHVLETGVMLGRHMEDSGTESATWSSTADPVVQSESYTMEYQFASYQTEDPVVPCLLRHAFQDVPVLLTDRIDAFGACRLPGGHDWPGTPMDVVGVETKNGTASLHLQGESSELRLDAWFEPQVPYPVHIRIQEEEDLLDLEITSYTRGDDDALAYVDTPRDPLPALVDQGRSASGLSFEGIDHPFPPEAAYQAAYDHPTNSAFRQWADANPGHTVIGIRFYDGSATGLQGETKYEWRMELRSEHARGDLEVHRTVVRTADGQEVPALDEYWFDGWSDTNEEFPLPSTHPSVKDLADRWASYLPAGMTVRPTDYWFEEEQDAWVLRAETWEEESTVPLVYAGDYKDHREDGWVAFDAAGNLLGMDYWRHSTESTQETIVDDAPSPTPNPEASDEPPAPTVLAARTDAPWVAPTPVQAAGAAGVAVATGFLVYLWPALKGLPFFGLFSRLRRPELLGHPSRKKTMDVIEADPGIHFQEILRRTGLSNGNLVHHLRKLHQAGMVSEAKTGGYTCYFAARHADRRTMKAAPVLRSDAARSMLDAINDHPGVNAKDLAARLGLGSSTVHYHLKRLEAVGLTQAKKEGRTMAFFPTDSARRLVPAA